jgi:hypothetical protein
MQLAMADAERRSDAGRDVPRGNFVIVLHTAEHLPRNA